MAKRRKKTGKGRWKWLLWVAAGLLLLGVIIWFHVPERVISYSADIDENEYQLRGIDLSAHNGKVDFGQVSDAGIDFVILKASEGSRFRDSRFDENYRMAMDNRLYVGAYHFFRFDVDGVVQARNFMGAVDGKDLSVPLVIDVEEYGNPIFFSTEKVVRRLRDMIDELTVNEYPVMIYTNKDGYAKFVRGNFDDYPLWLCTFSDPPETIEWTLWQYSHSGEVDGIKGDVDLNVFYGDEEQWIQWIR